MTKMTAIFVALLTAATTALCGAAAREVYAASSSTSSSTVSSTYPIAPNELVAEIRRGNILPLSDVLKIAATHYLGTVIEAKLELTTASATASTTTEPGTSETNRKVTHRLLYEIAVMSKEGKKHELHIDARTGEVLSN